MIKSITLKNFFSFEEQTVRLNPKVNLLVGINGSGKSNFIKAFELLRFGINEGTPVEKINDFGGLGRVRNFGNLKAEKVGIKLTLDSVAYGKEKEKDIDYELSTKKSNNVFAWFEKISKGEDIIRDEWVSNVQLLDISWITGDYEMETLEYYLKQILVYEDIDTSENGAKNKNQAKRNGAVERLSQDFKNLTDLLHSMSKSPERRGEFEIIEKAINDINVNLGKAAFKVTGGLLEMLAEDKPKQIFFESAALSVGTLKFITLMSILYNPNRGNIVCIEEPENNLHPDMINMVAKGIKYASKTSQMIVSTHSPSLLNSFEFEDILIFESDENYNTIVKELSQDNFEEWTDDFMIGQLWVNGFIGGKRW